MADHGNGARERDWFSFTVEVHADPLLLRLVPIVLVPPMFEVIRFANRFDRDFPLHNRLHFAILCDGALG